MARRVLHLLSQRPGRTGSGVTVQALVREAAAAGWAQAVVVGTPADDPPAQTLHLRRRGKRLVEPGLDRLAEHEELHANAERRPGAKKDESLIAKMDASKTDNFKILGQFWLLPVIAKMDALKVNIIKIPICYP